jgi:3',5'-cyclic AMP phosphodiesterase CpdA
MSGMTEAEGESTLVLRFRDLVVPTPGYTISQHRRIIEQSGYAWWGWWKKQTEKVPEALWSQLRRRTDGDRRISVYLLDSGQKCLYRAELAEVEFNPGREGIPAPEAGSKTPSYYASLAEPAPFATWFKLTQIEDASESELSEFAYEIAPHDEAIAVPESQIVGRKVGGIVELLQFGNVTYWVLRHAEAGAQRLGSLFTRSPKAIDGEHILTAARPWILHITDLHFGKNHAFPSAKNGTDPSLAQAIQLAIPHDRRPGIVLVSGDLTWSGARDEFELATECLNELRSVLGINPQNFVIVPGNHDLGWVNATESTGKAVYELANSTARAEYERFFSNWYSVSADNDLSIGRRFFVTGGPTLDVLGLNSSSMQQTENVFAGLGRIPDAAYKRSADALSWSEGLRPAQVRVVLVHHHVLPVSSVESAADSSRGFGLALDAGAQLNRAREYGVNLIVHGHQHQPFVASYSGIPLQGAEVAEGHAVLVLGGGSAGVQDHHLGAFRHRAFNLLRLHDKGVDVELFATHETATKFSRSVVVTGAFNGRWQRKKEES